MPHKGTIGCESQGRKKGGFRSTPVYSWDHEVLLRHDWGNKRPLCLTKYWEQYQHTHFHLQDFISGTFQGFCYSLLCFCRIDRSRLCQHILLPTFLSLFFVFWFEWDVKGGNIFITGEKTRTKKLNWSLKQPVNESPRSLGVIRPEKGPWRKGVQWAAWSKPSTFWQHRVVCN